jgi:hypothetical protein
MQVLSLLLDVVIGVLLAGVVAPLALAALPPEARGNSILLIVAVACIVLVAVLRRLVVTPSRAGNRGDGK